MIFLLFLFILTPAYAGKDEIKDIANPVHLKAWDMNSIVNLLINPKLKAERKQLERKKAEAFCRSKKFERVYSEDPRAIQTQFIRTTPAKKEFYILGTKKAPIRVISQAEFRKRKRNNPKSVFLGRYPKPIGGLEFSRLVCFKKCPDPPKPSLDDSCIPSSDLPTELSKVLTPVEKVVQPEKAPPQKTQLPLEQTSRPVKQSSDEDPVLEEVQTPELPSPPASTTTRSSNALDTFALENGAQVFLNQGEWCTGSLISEDIILTAGHCFEGGVLPTYVRIGNPPEDRTVISHEIHPDKLAGSPVADLAILRIQPPTPEKVKVLPLIFQDELKNERNELKNFEDIQLFGASTGRNHLIQASGFMAKKPHDIYALEEKEYLKRILLPELSKRPRAGDSGGPLYVKKDGNWRIAGTLIGAAKEYMPIEVTAIGNYKDWIQSGIHRLGGKPAPQALTPQFSSIQFSPLSPNQIRTYYDEVVRSYVNDLKQQGGLDQYEAELRATKEFSAFFPNQSPRPGVSVFRIQGDGQDIGNAVYEKQGNTAFIVDFEIFKKFRGQKLGTKSFQALEKKLKSEGFNKIRLQVLSGNHVAVKLYKDLGFEGPSLNQVMTLEKNI